MPLTPRPNLSAASKLTATGSNPRIGALVAGPIAPGGDLRKGCTCLARRAEVTVRTRRLAPDRPAQLPPTEAGGHCGRAPSGHDGKPSRRSREPVVWNLSETHSSTMADRRFTEQRSRAGSPKRASRRIATSPSDLTPRRARDTPSPCPGSHCRPLPIESPRQAARLSVTARAVRRPRTGCVSANRLMGGHLCLSRP